MKRETVKFIRIPKSWGITPAELHAMLPEVLAALKQKFPKLPFARIGTITAQSPREKRTLKKLNRASAFASTSSLAAATLARIRWARIPKPERAKQVPHTGGRPRKTR